MISLQNLLKELKFGFYNTKVKFTPQEAQIIERETTDQGDSDIWIAE